MSLIKCRECGKEISSEANSCPFCGCPIVDYSEMKQILAYFDNRKDLFEKKERISNSIKRKENELKVKKVFSLVIGITGLALLFLIALIGIIITQIRSCNFYGFPDYYLTNIQDMRLDYIFGDIYYIINCFIPFNILLITLLLILRKKVSNIFSICLGSFFALQYLVSTISVFYFLFEDSYSMMDTELDTLLGYINMALIILELLFLIILTIVSCIAAFLKKIKNNPFIWILDFGMIAFYIISLLLSILRDVLYYTNIYHIGIGGILRDLFMNYSLSFIYLFVIIPVFVILFILWDCWPAKKRKKLAAEYNLVEKELSDYYSKYVFKDVTIDKTYCNPVVLRRIYDLLLQKKANNITEAINIIDSLYKTK